MSLEKGNGRAGFDARPVMNNMLALLAQCEVIPQRVLGTSVMAVFTNGDQGKQ